MFKWLYLCIFCTYPTILNKFDTILSIKMANLKLSIYVLLGFLALISSRPLPASDDSDSEMSEAEQDMTIHDREKLVVDCVDVIFGQRFDIASTIQILTSGVGYTYPRGSSISINREWSMRSRVNALWLFVATVISS